MIHVSLNDTARRHPPSPALAVFFRYAADVAEENASAVPLGDLLQAALDGASAVVRLGTLPAVTASEEEQARAMIDRAFRDVDVTARDIVVALRALAVEAEEGAVEG